MPSLIGVDLDRTLAQYDTYQGPSHIGEPILPMVTTVLDHLVRGDEVVIFTARVHPDHTPEERDEARTAIQAWCLKHLGQTLGVTCMKSPRMHLFYDDRACSIYPNTGRRVDGLDGYLGLPPTPE